MACVAGAGPNPWIVSMLTSPSYLTLKLINVILLDRLKHET